MRCEGVGHVRAPRLLPGRQADRDVLHLLRVRLHRHPHPRHAPLLSGEHQDGLYLCVSISVRHYNLIMIDESHLSIVEIKNVWVCDTLDLVPTTLI